MKLIASPYATVSSAAIAVASSFSKVTSSADAKETLKVFTLSSTGTSVSWSATVTVISAVSYFSSAAATVIVYSPDATFSNLNVPSVVEYSLSPRVTTASATAVPSSSVIVPVTVYVSITFSSSTSHSTSLSVTVTSTSLTAYASSAGSTLRV